MSNGKTPDFNSSTASSSQNETLESFAVAQKMTVSNVKNMIYHILTDATLFATLVDSDKQAIPHIRLTRSRWREIQQKVNVEHPPEINLNPVVTTARTFLDVDYGNNEDDDPEYDPTNEDWEDDAFQYNFDSEDLLLPASDIDYLTNGMDPQYLEFINSCVRDDINLDLDMSDDEGDEEYNVMPDEQNLEKSKNKDTYEFRNDRSTEISSREISALWGDFDIDVDLHRREPLAVPPSNYLIERENSAGIFERPLRLSGDEVKLLKSQFEQHLQLLFQSIVGCTGKADLTDPYSNAMTMFNDLVGDRKPHPVLLDPVDLENCHTSVCYLYDQAHEVWPTFNSTVRPPTARKGCSAEPLSLRSRWIYAQSSFIHYPALIPSVEFFHFGDSFTAFLPHERALLAFGLFVFQKVPLASARQPVGRYQCIQKYLMPNRNTKQLRVHIKHSREKKNMADGLTQFLVAAFEGNWTLRADRLVAHTARESGFPIHWPKNQQPEWLKEIASYQMVYRKDNNIYSAFIVRDNQLLKPSLENMENSQLYFEQFMKVATPMVAVNNTIGCASFTASDERIESHVAVSNAETTLPSTSYVIQNHAEAPEHSTSYVIQDHDVEVVPTTSYTILNPAENTVPYRVENPLPSTSSTTQNRAETLIQSTSYVPLNHAEAPMLATSYVFPVHVETSVSSTLYETQSPVVSSAPTENVNNESALDNSATNDYPSPHYSDAAPDPPPMEVYEAPMDPAEGMSRSSYLSDRQTESMDEFSRDADTRSSDAPERVEVCRSVEDTANDEPVSEDERSRTLQRRHVDVLKALTDPENRHKAFEGLVAAVQNDINRRFFMHDVKLKKFRAIVGQSSKSPAEILEELKTSLDDVDQEIVFVLASLLHDEQLTPSIREDPQFHRIKKALDMIMDVQTYVYGTRGLKTLKHIAKSFRNEQLNNVDELKAILKNLFRRDPKVCHIFLPDESCETSNSKYEEINLSEINRNGIEGTRVVYETIEIPYKRPCHQSLRAQPQLYHGHIIHEQSGVEVHCDIRYESKFEWSDAADLDLLKQVLIYGSNYNNAAKAFCSMPKYGQVTMVDAMDRLIYLRSLNTG